MAARPRPGKSGVVLLLVVASAGLILIAGELEPPGPPAPTMKPLDEVEPRIPIQSSDLPLTILEPGSYYLTENSGDQIGGITISASDVTVDLMGFSLTNGGGDGIFASVGVRNVTVKNGTVSAWGASGINLNNVVNCQVINVRADGNVDDGILVGDGCQVIDSVARDNFRNGIWAGDGCTITNCTAVNNAVDGIRAGNGCVIDTSTTENNSDHGILAGASCSITHCTARLNTGNGINATGTISHCTAGGNQLSGILAGSGSVISHCRSVGNGLDGIRSGTISTDRGSTVIASVASSNSSNGINVGNGSNVVECIVRNNTENGIVAQVGSRVIGNTAFDNTEGGILVTHACLVKDNHCDLNGGAGFDDGIRVTGADNRVEDNNVTRNGACGILIDSSGNVIVRNSASGNGTNYCIAAGNAAGSIVSTPAGAGAWDNLEF